FGGRTERALQPFAGPVALFDLVEGRVGQYLVNGADTAVGSKRGGPCILPHGQSAPDQALRAIFQWATDGGRTVACLDFGERGTGRNVLHAGAGRRSGRQAASGAAKNRAGVPARPGKWGGFHAGISLWQPLRRPFLNNPSDVPLRRSVLHSSDCHA